MDDYQFFPNETHRSLTEAVRNYPLIREPHREGEVLYVQPGESFGEIRTAAFFPFSARLAQRRVRSSLAELLGPQTEGKTCAITDEWSGSYRGPLGIPIYGCALRVVTREPIRN